MGSVGSAVFLLPMSLADVGKSNIALRSIPGIHRLNHVSEACTSSPCTQLSDI